MKILGLIALGLMLVRPYAEAQEDASAPPVPDSSVSAPPAPAPASPSPTISGTASTVESTTSGGVGEGAALRAQIERLDRAERDELHALTDRYEGDRRAIRDKYRAQRQPLEQQRSALRQQYEQSRPQQATATSAASIKPVAAGAKSQQTRVGDHRDDEARRRERERHERERREREEEWRRRHPVAHGWSNDAKPGVTAASKTAPATTPKPATPESANR